MQTHSTIFCGSTISKCNQPTYRSMPLTTEHQLFCKILTHVSHFLAMLHQMKSVVDDWQGWFDLFIIYIHIYTGFKLCIYSIYVLYKYHITIQIWIFELQYSIHNNHLVNLLRIVLLGIVYYTNFKTDQQFSIKNTLSMIHKTLILESKASRCLKWKSREDVPTTISLGLISYSTSQPLYEVFHRHFCSWVICQGSTGNLIFCLVLST